VIDSDPEEDVGAREVAGGGQHSQPEPLGHDGGGQPDGRGAAADQQGLAGLGVQTDSQGAVGGL
jgi:hypothetical protein